MIYLVFLAGVVVGVVVSFIVFGLMLCSDRHAPNPVQTYRDRLFADIVENESARGKGFPDINLD